MYVVFGSQNLALVEVSHIPRNVMLEDLDFHKCDYFYFWEFNDYVFNRILRSMRFSCPKHLLGIIYSSQKGILIPNREHLGGY